MNSYAAMRPRPEGGHSQSIKPEFGVQNQSPESERERENDAAMLGYKNAKVARRAPDGGQTLGPRILDVARVRKRRPLVSTTADEAGHPPKTVPHKITSSHLAHVSMTADDT